jgi:hypothetical protein
VTRRALAGAVAVMSATVTVSVIEGTPRQLPGVALGSPVLLARATQARNAVRRTEVERRVASPRRIAERLRASSR